jgi:hypothetical protein
MRANKGAKEMGRPIWICLGALAAILISSHSVVAQPIAIAGIGVTRCHEFNQQIDREPKLEDYYFSWAQGFMSGVLLRGRTGQDETVALVQAQHPPEQQREFLKSYCRRNPLRYYFHATAALYQQLGGTSLNFLL